MAHDTTRLRVLEQENERLRRSVRELSLLNELAREIGASHEADVVVRSIVKQALKSVGAEQGVLAIVEERDGDPMTTFVRTAGSDATGDFFSVNDSLMGWMLTHKKPLRLDDPATDPRFRGTRWHPSLRSVLCVPLFARGRLLGLLAVFNNKTPGGFTADDQRLLSIIASQSAQIVENARLYEEEKALIGMREELRLAHEIQTSLLPTEAPTVPGYAIAGYSRPAQRVGGDYFDYVPLGADRYALCVADVSGKGLPAALVMANLQAMLRAGAPWAAAPAACLEHVNRMLCPRLRKESFVTLVYGVLDPEAHTFRFSNAGHNRPLVRQAGGEVSRLDFGELVLGFRPEQTYGEDVLRLGAGDTLLLYTDGVSEAMNARREEFGEETLAALLAHHGEASPAALINQLVEAVDAHIGEAPPHDDVTLLVAKRLDA